MVHKYKHNGNGNGNIRCEVLNTTYEPLSILPAKRGLVVCLKGRAKILKEHPTAEIQSGGRMHKLPTQIVLLNTAKSRVRGPAKLTQKNLFIRDKYCCQYCGRHRSELQQGEFLTRDHIIPQDKGGRDTWLNLLTACNRCNNRKANGTAKSAGLIPLKMPSVPSFYEIWAQTMARNRRI